MIRSTVRTVLNLLDEISTRIFGRSRLLARALYAFASPRFAREQAAVLYGRSLFGGAAFGQSDPQLRRNTHRLEKGLLMRPRAATFATDYISETVEAFERACASSQHDAAEWAWAHDVLTEYFRVVVSTATIAAAELRFREAVTLARSSAAADAGRARVPKPRAETALAGIDYDRFLALCRQRRSVRWFLPKPVPLELLEHAVRAAAEAPSACNRQPFFFRLLGEPEQAARAASIAMGTGGYAHQIPALIVVLGDFSSFAHERDRHLPYIDGALASMQLMLALETLGLASCPINWPDVETLERRMDRALNLPRHIRPIMLIGIGYPDPEGGVAHSEKKPVSLLLKTRNDYGA
jgi:nitroreductase